MPLTVAQLKTYHDAQLRYVREYLTDETIAHLDVSDDTNDYVNSLIELAHDLRTALYHCQFDSTLNDDDIVPADVLPFQIDDPDADNFLFDNYACDGVCNELHVAFHPDDADE